MALRHRADGHVRCFHRPDQADAVLDLAVVEHDGRTMDLHGGAAGPRVDKKPRVTLAQPVQGFVERDGRLRWRCMMVRSRVSAPVPGWVWIVCRPVTTKLSARSVSSPTS